MVPQAAHYGANNIVYARTEPAACYDTGVYVFRHKVYHLTGTGLFEHHAPVDGGLLAKFNVQFQPDKIFVRNIVGDIIAVFLRHGYRRADIPRPKFFYGKIQGVFTHNASINANILLSVTSAIITFLSEFHNPHNMRQAASNSRYQTRKQRSGGFDSHVIRLRVWFP
jgi:hypothetical protein